MISFRGSLIGPITVQKRMKDDTFKNHEVSLVELFAHDKDDLEAVRKVSRSWSPKGHYAADVADAMAIANFTQTRMTQKLRYYIATEQKDSFEKINAGEVLGVALVTKTSPELGELNYLQVNPEHTFFEPNKKYRGIGSAILKSIKPTAGIEQIIVEASQSAMKFYEKHGYKLINRSREMLG